MNQPEPTEHGCESIVLSGNTFGECVMINVGSPNCTGASKSMSLSERNLAEDRVYQLNKLLLHPKLIATFRGGRVYWPCKFTCLYICKEMQVVGNFLNRDELYAPKLSVRSRFDTCLPKSNNEFAIKR